MKVILFKAEILNNCLITLTLTQQYRIQNWLNTDEPNLYTAHIGRLINSCCLVENNTNLVENNTNKPN